MYGHLLQPILLKLLPEDPVLDFNRKHLGKKEEDTFDVMKLLQLTKIEIECRESANVYFLCSRSPLAYKFETIRLMLDYGGMRRFITREISRQLKLPVVRKETFFVYAFGTINKRYRKTCNVVKVIIENRDEPSLNIEIVELETDPITATNMAIQLDEEDSDVTLFLWYEDPDGSEELIRSYRMTRVGKKWKLPQANLKLGQLEILKEPSKIPMERTLGRIEVLHPGSDGLVRIILFLKIQPIYNL
ncbi:DUF1758 domain-containing protein [Trichonephila inaurata madagascariensis]|uniref:DUF1758 domain-containing protein n=1 Tax=Trichonephila inaurata madagascariensis TaxID=2747483 RepID=A0A8X7C6X1_9ARAC|nr:DUF1758 domain-containing protein [Trichonephila inaurata madagascariensis]